MTSSVDEKLRDTKEIVLNSIQPGTGISIDRDENFITITNTNNSIMKEDRVEINTTTLNSSVMNSFDVKSQNIISVYPIIKLLNNIYPSKFNNNFSFYGVENNDDNSTTIVWNDDMDLNTIKEYIIVVRYY